MREIAILLIAGCVLNGCSHQPADRAENNGAGVIPGGTYRIDICSGDCRNDKRAIHGILVLDRTREAFSGQSEAMQFLMRADTGMLVPNYCYYFDPETSNSRDTLFEYDIVSFGEQGDEAESSAVLHFLIDSPDFRYASNVRVHRRGQLIGDWSSIYAGDGGVQHSYPSTRLYAERISDADGSVCFDAVRKHERGSLKGYCEEFSARTCEPGDKPSFQGSSEEP